MRTKKADKMLRIMAVIAALVMVVALFPDSKIETSAASVNTKLYKTISCQLTGRETKIVTFGSDIASITYGSQAPASMKKISARKVEVKGVKNGTTKFYVVTKDKRHITCNVTRNNALIMNTNSTRVIKTATKIKSVKSLNPSIATATLSSGKTFYVVKTKNKKAAAFGCYGWSGESVKVLQEKLKEGEASQILSDVGALKMSPEELAKVLALVKSGQMNQGTAENTAFEARTNESGSYSKEGEVLNEAEEIMEDTEDEAY